jgi:outer membrane protein assembly factor BamB
MTRICWWLVDLASGLLDPDEREAVRGDLAESGDSGGHALCGVLGLIFRRQAALWRDWRPWLVLFGLVGPAGVLLSLNRFGLQRTFDLYLWIFRNSRDIDPAILRETGLTVRHGMVLLLRGSLLLGVWSWMSGFVLGLLSHRTIAIHGALFCLVLLLGAFWGVSPGRQYLYGVNGGMFPLLYYTAIFPLILHAALVLLPSLCGIYHSHRLTISWRRWRGTSALLLAAALIGCGGSAAAQTSPQDYPQWRGHDRDGSASAFSKPRVWPEKLTRRWKVEVGEGYATPLIIGGTIYSFTRRNDNEVMIALNAADGHILWQTSYAAAYKMGDPAKAHGPGPKATPLYHNGKLYTLGISGIVSAFDAASGKLVWQKPAPAEHPFFGAASSPVGDKDLVIFHPGNYGPLTAFDAITGAVRWTAKGDGMYASPMIVELGGIRQIVSMGQQNIVGVAAGDGSSLWQYPWAGEGGGMQAITPVIYGGTIIVSSYHAGVTALRPDRRGGKWVVDVVWETKDVSLFLSNPVLIGGTLFGLSEKAGGQFFALDSATGKVLWLGKPRQATNVAVVKAGDLLFLLNEAAELIVARANRTGFEPLKTYTVADSATWAQPAISGNRVIVKDVSSLALWALN